MQTNWDDLRTLLWVVRGKTLAAAAEALGVNYTTVARRIARLEAAMRLELFEKRPEGYVPTDAARTIAEHAATMEDSENALLRTLAGRDDALSGQMTLTAPQLLIAHVLAPVIDAFTRAHPQIDLRVRATNDLLDLDRREADVAIRISRSPGDALKGLRLSAQHSASFASPAMAERIARHPGDPIDWIVYDQAPGLPINIDPAYPDNRIRMRFDDMVAMQGAAQAGLGVLRMPMFLGRATPGLMQVPVLPPQPYADIWVVAHADVWPSAKLAAFRERLIPHFRRIKAQFVA